jgi:hypothetical protein
MNHQPDLFSPDEMPFNLVIEGRNLFDFDLEMERRRLDAERETQQMKFARYALTQFDNGKFGVLDTSTRDGCKTVAAGMTQAEAADWMDSLNAREAAGK